MFVAYGRPNRGTNLAGLLGYGGFEGRGVFKARFHGRAKRANASEASQAGFCLVKLAFLGPGNAGRVLLVENKRVCVATFVSRPLGLGDGEQLKLAQKLLSFLQLNVSKEGTLE